jgi:hypothetical protein
MYNKILFQTSSWKQETNIPFTLLIEPHIGKWQQMCLENAVLVIEVVPCIIQLVLELPQGINKLWNYIWGH